MSGVIQSQSVERFCLAQVEVNSVGSVSLVTVKVVQYIIAQANRIDPRPGHLSCTVVVLIEDSASLDRFLVWN